MDEENKKVDNSKEDNGSEKEVKETKEMKSEEKEFKQIKVKKRRPFLTFIIVLLIIMLLAIGALYALVKTNVIKKEYIKVFLKTKSYKQIETGYFNAVNSKNVKSEISGNVEVEGLSEESNEEANKIADIIKNSKITTITNKVDDKEYNFGFAFDSYNEKVLDLIANIKDNKAIVAEKNLVNKTVFFENDEIEKMLEESIKKQEEAKELIKNIVKLTDKSFKIKGELGNIFMVSGRGNTKTITINDELTTDRVVEAFETIAKELKKDDEKEILEDIIKNILVLSNEDASDKKELASKVIEKLEKINEEDKKEIKEVLDVLKGQKVVLEFSDNKISKIEFVINTKTEIDGQKIKIKANLKLQMNYSRDSKVFDDLKKEDQMELNTNEDLEKLLKEIDVNKIIDKIFNLKIVEKLDVKDQKEEFTKMFEGYVNVDEKENKSETYPSLDKNFNKIDKDKESSSKLTEKEKEEFKKQFLEELEKEEKNKNQEKK